MNDKILDGCNNSFLQFLEARESPMEKVNKSHFNSQAKIFLAAISKLVDSISQLNDLLSAERRNDISLTNENPNMNIEIMNLKDRNCRATSPYHSVTTKKECGKLFE